MDLGVKDIDCTIEDYEILIMEARYSVLNEMENVSRNICHSVEDEFDVLYDIANIVLFDTLRAEICDL